MPFNLSAFKHCIVSHVPFNYFIITGLLTPDTIHTLYQDAPFNNLMLTTRKEGSDKTYHLYNTPLIDHTDGKITDNLPTSWQTLLQGFLSDDYQKNISELVSKDLSQCYVQSMLKVYQADSYISMHTDDKEVLLTHLFFLNPHYDFSNRGNLIFHDQFGKAMVHIPPNVHTSVIFERTDCSFHSVESCLSDQSPKMTLQVVFWKTKNKRNYEGRNYL